jgi:hypothetical protein
MFSLLKIGYFVLNQYASRESSNRCIECDPNTQLCDELHQIRPKPLRVGIWISPQSGVSFSCEPIVACIKHKTVIEVLQGTCTSGYKVGFSEHSH